MELADQMQAKNFWDDSAKAKKISQEYDQLSKFYNYWIDLEKKIFESINLVKENHDESEDTKKYLEGLAVSLEDEYKQNRFLALLNKKYDDQNAIFSVHSGAGGVDAQDRADMLLLMFCAIASAKILKQRLLN